MGTNCNVSCKQKASELEIKKTDPQKLKSIIKVGNYILHLNKNMIFQLMV